jgi:HNH endonuclease
MPAHKLPDIKVVCKGGVYNKSVIDRFWKYAEKGLTDDECWFWIGSIMQRGGYGQLNDRHKILKSHILSYEIHIGKIPDRLNVLHKCNISRCWNPKHLYAGTHKQNTADAIKAGTLHVFEVKKGTDNHNAKLTIEQVKIIKGSKPYSIKGLDKKFGVTKTCISRIRKGLSWKSVTIP